MDEQLSPLEQFLKDYVEAVDGAWELVEPQVYDVLLPGVVIRGLGVGGQEEDEAMLRVTFEPEAVPEHPGSQLLTYGSPLLDRIFAHAWEQSRIARVYLLGLNLATHQVSERVRSSLEVPPGSTWEIQRVRPLFFTHAAFWFQATFSSDEKEQENYVNVVDLHYGRFARHLEELLRREEVPYTLAEERPFPWPDASRCPLVEGYRRARERVVGTAAAVANTHVVEQEQRAGRQIERMQRYYRDLENELRERLEKARGDGRTRPETRNSLEERLQGVVREEKIRIAEMQQRSALHMHLRLLNLMLIAYPKFCIQSCLAPEKGPPLALTLVWDPLAGHLEPPPCPHCGLSTLVLVQTHLGGVACPECLERANALQPGTGRQKKGR